MGAKMRKRIAFCGNSLFLAGIQASLGIEPDLEVLRIDSIAPYEGSLDPPVPDYIIFDLAAPHPDFSVSLLRDNPNLTLIGLELQANQALVISGHNSNVITVDDLLHLVNYPKEPAPEGPNNGRLIADGSSAAPSIQS